MRTLRVTHIFVNMSQNGSKYCNFIVHDKNYKFYLTKIKAVIYLKDVTDSHFDKP